MKHQNPHWKPQCILFKKLPFYSRTGRRPRRRWRGGDSASAARRPAGAPVPRPAAGCPGQTLWWITWPHHLRPISFCKPAHIPHSPRIIWWVINILGIWYSVDSWFLSGPATLVLSLCVETCGHLDLGPPLLSPPRKKPSHATIIFPANVETTDECLVFGSG